MNRIAKILLSIVIVSLSVLVFILKEHSENIETEIVTVQVDSIMGNQREIIYNILYNEEDEIKSDYNVAIEEMNQRMAEIESITDKMEWFIAYKKVIDEYSYIIDPPENIYDYFTEEEITLICRVVETECYDKDFDSKCNVASVVLNRIRQGGAFGNSVTEVITKKNQFAYGRENITKSTILSIMYVYEVGDTTDGCIAFRNDQCPQEWYGWEYMFTDDIGHNFYK